MHTLLRTDVGSVLTCSSLGGMPSSLEDGKRELQSHRVQGGEWVKNLSSHSYWRDGNYNRTHKGEWNLSSA